jgi:hypothetical protein
MFDPKIAISGAAGGEAGEQGEHLAYEVGRQIAIHGGIVLTGATTGVPLAAARGAKAVKGEVIGFSPANSLVEHTRKYRLPTQYHDTMFFTGQDYAGRDITLVDLSDAVINISGRVGTLHEFTHAFERNMIIGLLLKSGGTIDQIPIILEMADRGMGKVIMHEDPRQLVRHVFAAIDKANLI